MGSARWVADVARLAYRFNGKQKTLALGHYPDVSLLEARKARDASKWLLRDGKDPSADRKAKRRKSSLATANTYQPVANEWFEANQNRWVKSYSLRLRSRLDDDLLPSPGKRPIAEIEPWEVLDTIRKIESRDAIEMAKRVTARQQELAGQQIDPVFLIRKSFGPLCLGTRNAVFRHDFHL